MPTTVYRNFHRDCLFDIVTLSLGFPLFLDGSQSYLNGADDFPADLGCERQPWACLSDASVTYVCLRDNTLLTIALRDWICKNFESKKLSLWEGVVTL